MVKYNCLIIKGRKLVSSGLIDKKKKGKKEKEKEKAA